MAKAKTDERATTATDRALKSPQTATVTSEDIARHAYDIYRARGCEHGHDVADWLQAERELHGDPEC